MSKENLPEKRAERISVVVTLILLGLATSAAADSSCDRLLQHGITNITRYQSADHAIAYKWNKYCGIDYNSASDTQVANASATVFGYGSGEAGYNSSQQRTKLISWCNQNSAFAENQSAMAQEAQILSEPALSSWEQCIEMSRKQINIKFLPTGDNDEFVHFEIDSTHDGNLKYFGVTKTNYTCTEQMIRAVDNKPVDVAAQPDITNSNIQIDCTRADPKVTEENGTGKILYEAGYIAINTSGPSFATSFPKVVSQYYVTPPGTVIAFDSEQCPEGWTAFTKADGKFVLGTSGEYKIRSSGGAASHTHEVKHNSATRKPAHILEAIVKGDAEVKSADSMPPYVALKYCKRS